MNNIFLPKELNKGDGSPICYDAQSGSIKTDIHWHSCAEIIHIKGGEALLFSDESWVELGAGDTIFLPPGHLHCCHCAESASRRIVIGIEERLFSTLGPCSDFITLPFRTTAPHVNLIFRDNPNLKKLFARLADDKEDNGISGELEKIILIEEIYREMLSIWEKNGYINREKNKSPLVKRLLALINEKFAENIDACKIAAELNISYSYMANLIHKELNTNFGDLVLSARVDAAKRLLLTTDMSITDIALETGFTDSSYFIKKFRLFTGTTPHKYRFCHIIR